MARIQVNHNMIVLARQLRKLTQNELLNELGITQGKFSKIEQGLQSIDEKIFKRLISKLKFPESFFIQTGQIFPAEINFYRKKRSLSKKDGEFINALLNYKYRALIKLLESIEVESNLPFFDIEDYDDPKQIAITLRKYWNIPHGPIDNLTRWLEKAGIFIFYIDGPTDKFDGIRFSVDTNLPIVALNRNMPSDRIRFSLAHELGHLVMHKYLTPTADDESNIFASEFLIPSTQITFPTRKLKLSDFADLKRYWKVSMAALIMKARDLNKLTNSQSRYFWQQLSKLGYKKREPATLDPPKEEPTIIKELIRMHSDDLGYDESELISILNVNKYDFEEWWQPYINDNKKPQLRLIISDGSQ